MTKATSSLFIWVSSLSSTVVLIGACKFWGMFDGMIISMRIYLVTFQMVNYWFSLLVRKVQFDLFPLYLFTHTFLFVCFICFLSLSLFLPSVHYFIYSFIYYFFVYAFSFPLLLLCALFRVQKLLEPPEQTLCKFGQPCGETGKSVESTFMLNTVQVPLSTVWLRIQRSGQKRNETVCCSTLRQRKNKESLGTSNKGCWSVHSWRAATNYVTL